MKVIASFVGRNKDFKAWLAAGMPASENMTEVSCTFVKCKYNDYGKKGICQAKYIQIGELVTPGTDKTEPVCVWFKKKM